MKNKNPQRYPAELRFFDIICYTILVALVMGLFLYSYGAEAKKACAPESPSLLNFACERGETWVLGIGASGEYGSKADGSTEFGSEIEPGILFHASNDWGQFFFDGQETGFRLFPSENFNWMVGARLEPGREEADDPVLLAGQGDSDDEIMGRLEGRLNLIGHWNFWTGVSSLIGNGDIGQLHILVLGAGIDRIGPVDLELLVYQRWATSAFINKDFGVDQEQSARSGNPVYRASSGAQSTGVQLVGKIDVSKDIKVLLDSSYDRYASRLEDSPIIQKGRNDEYEIGATVLYLF